MASTQFEKNTSIVPVVPLQAGIAACLETATKRRDHSGITNLAGSLEEGYAQSIIVSIKRYLARNQIAVMAKCPIGILRGRGYVPAGSGAIQQ
jgi:hypothetical protein